MMPRLIDWLRWHGGHQGCHCLMCFWLMCSLGISCLLRPRLIHRLIDHRVSTLAFAMRSQLECTTEF